MKVPPRNIYVSEYTGTKENCRRSGLEVAILWDVQLCSVTARWSSLNSKPKVNIIRLMYNGPSIRPSEISINQETVRQPFLTKLYNFVFKYGNIDLFVPPLGFNYKVWSKSVFYLTPSRLSSPVSLINYRTGCLFVSLVATAPCLPGAGSAVYCVQPSCIPQ